MADGSHKISEESSLIKTHEQGGTALPKEGWTSARLSAAAALLAAASQSGCSQDQTSRTKAERSLSERYEPFGDTNTKEQFVREVHDEMLRSGEHLPRDILERGSRSDGGQQEVVPEEKAETSPPEEESPEIPTADLKGRTYIVVDLAKEPDLEPVWGWIDTLRANGDVVFLMRVGKHKFQANSIICTHKGCVVAWRYHQKMFLCPCHRAGFDVDGKVFAGPASKDLKRYETLYYPNKQKVYVFTD